MNNQRELINMSWLEYLGLKSLFSSDVAVSGGGILFVLAVIIINF